VIPAKSSQTVYRVNMKERLRRPAPRTAGKYPSQARLTTTSLARADVAARHHKKYLQFPFAGTATPQQSG
jgi:hypothetical protein